MTYVLGFVFSDNPIYFIEQRDRFRVALIRKNKPIWQAGKLNGIGGKIEEGETPIEAMRREFAEEAGVRLDEWKHFVTLVGDVWAVYCFSAYGLLSTLENKTEEEIEIYPVLNLPSDVLWNLRWMIPLALDGNIKVPPEILDATYPS